MTKDSTKPKVFVVGDDPAAGRSLARLIEGAGLNADMYASPTAFLESYGDSYPGCLVVDVRMPHMSGLALLERLRSDGAAIPVILISRHGDVSMAVQAMKAGAFDFIEKPFSDDMLLDRIQKALEHDRKTRQDRAEQQKVAARVSALTPRERDVLDLVLAGMLNKEIAAELGLSIKTVETHRAHIMGKLGARTTADLVRTAHPGRSFPESRNSSSRAD